MNLRFLLLLAIGLATAFQLKSQSDPYADSLRQVVESRPTETSKIELLDSICAYYKGTYRPGGAPFFQLRKELIDPESNLEEGLIRLKESSFYLMRTGEMDLARGEIDFYFMELEEVKDRSSKANVLYCKSFLEEQVQNNELALTAIEQAIEEHVILQDSSSIEYGDSYRARGRILSSMGRFAEANVAYSKAKEMFAATSDSIGMSEVLAQLGILYAQIGLYDDSEAYINERYRYIPNAPDIMRITDLVNLGRNILMQRRYADAKANYQKALDMRPYENGYEQIEIYAYNGLLEASYFNGDYNEVIPLFEEMDSVYQVLGAREDIDFLMGQSRFFALLLNGEFKKAEVIGEGLYAASLEKHDASEAMLHAEFLTELYKRNGDYENALKYSELYSVARDSILTANKTNALLLYQTRFETKEKELEIDKLAIEKKVEENKSRTYLWIAGLLGALLLIGGGLYLQLRKTRAKLEVQNVELQSLNATKNKFFGIIGHDLGGPLVVFQAIGKRIRRQAVSNDLEKITKSADLLTESSTKLTSLLDNLLKWALSENGVMPYHPEKLDLGEIIRENVELFEEQSKEKEIRINLDFQDSSMIHADKNAVSTVCRNLISNALKFTPEGGRVDLKVKYVDGMVELTCIDSGVGMDADKVAELFTQSNRSERGTAGESGTGLGMTLIKELTELNKGKISVESQVGEGTVFRILLPSA